MKSIKEKQHLVNLAKALGQNADPALVKELAAFNAIKQDAHASIKKTALKDLTEAFKKVDLEKEIQQVIEYPVPPTLDEVLQTLKEEDNTNELVQPQAEEAPIRESETTDPEPTLAERAAKIISEAPKKDSFQQPDPDPVEKNFREVQLKLKFLEQAVGKIAAYGPGGGAGDTTSITSYTKLVTSPTYVVSRKDYYVGINYSGATTITLPSINVENGRQLVIKDESGNASLNPITVLGNVDNDPNGFIIKINNGGIQLIYRNGWRII